MANSVREFVSWPVNPGTLLDISICMSRWTEHSVYKPSPLIHAVHFIASFRIICCSFPPSITSSPFLSYHPTTYPPGSRQPPRFNTDAARSPKPYAPHHVSRPTHFMVPQGGNAHWFTQRSGMNDTTISPPRSHGEGNSAVHFHQFTYPLPNRLVDAPMQDQPMVLQAPQRMRMGALNYPGSRNYLYHVREQPSAASAPGADGNPRIFEEHRSHPPRHEYASSVYSQLPAHQPDPYAAQASPAKLAVSTMPSSSTSMAVQRPPPNHIRRHEPLDSPASPPDLSLSPTSIYFSADRFPDTLSSLATYASGLTPFLSHGDPKGQMSVFLSPHNLVNPSGTRSQSLVPQFRLPFNEPAAPSEQGCDADRSVRRPFPTSLPALSIPSTTNFRTHRSESSLSSALEETDFFDSGESSSPASVNGHDLPISPPDDRKLDMPAKRLKARVVASTTRRPQRQSRRPVTKMHRCSLCDKSFSRPSGLETHQNSHSGNKPFSCTQCSMKFTVRSNARRHLKTHGVYLPQRQEVPQVYTVGFSEPHVLEMDNNVMKIPAKLKWIPQPTSTVSVALSVSRRGSKAGIGGVNDDLHDFDGVPMSLGIDTWAGHSSPPSCSVSAGEEDESSETDVHYA